MQLVKRENELLNQGIVKLPLTHNGGAPVAFATRKDIAISSQFLVNHLNY